MAVLRTRRPVLRTGSRFAQFRQRLPPDIRALIANGVVVPPLSIPVGPTIVDKRLSPRATHVALSLGTADRVEGDRRNAVVGAYLDNVWTALRRVQPVSLSRRQVTALAGELYHAWIGSAEGARGLFHTPDNSYRVDVRSGGGWKPVHMTDEDEQGAFSLMRGELAAMKAEDLEPRLGPTVDRLLLGKGIGAVDKDTRPALLLAFHRALGEAYAAREREAGGDYAADVAASRFPPWPKDAERAHVHGLLSLSALSDLWAQDAKGRRLKSSTRDNYALVIRNLAAYLKQSGRD